MTVHIYHVSRWRLKLRKPIGHYTRTSIKGILLSIQILVFIDFSLHFWLIVVFYGWLTNAITYRFTPSSKKWLPIVWNWYCGFASSTLGSETLFVRFHVVCGGWSSIYGTIDVVAWAYLLLKVILTPKIKFLINPFWWTQIYVVSSVHGISFVKITINVLVLTW